MVAPVILRPYQEEAVAAVRDRWAAGDRATLLVMATGCHEPTQGILMADGSVKQAQEVAVGDLLMGPDGEPRTVLALHGGRDAMYRVVPVKGQPFTVNSEHVLSLVRTNRGGGRSKGDGSVVNVTVREWLSESPTFKHVHKLYRAEAISRFRGNDGSGVTIDPYFLGVLLGDGGMTGSVNVTTMDDEVVQVVYEEARKRKLQVRIDPSGKANTYTLSRCRRQQQRNPIKAELGALGLAGHGAGDKFVPQLYKTLPIGQRAEVLAGLLDTDGYATNGGYDFVSKSRQLAEDVAFMARSMGLAAYVSETVKGIRELGFTGTYWRVSISGDCTVVPMRVARKRPRPRLQKKSVLRTGVTVTYAGFGEYRGFTVDGDNLYLMDDFTVTHNCGKTTAFGEVARKSVQNGKRVMVLAHRSELIDQAARRLSAMCGVPAEIEKAESAYTYESPLCIASVQTLQGGRLDALRDGWFDVLIIDEAHHSVSPSYRAVIDKLGCWTLGVTATADRADRRGLAEVYDSIAYEYPLARAVAEGYLSPIKAKCVPLRLDLSGVKVSNGDYQAGDLGAAIEPYLDEIAAAMAEECAGRKTVCFLPLVSTAEKMADALGAAGLRAVCASGYDARDERAAKLSAFERGDYDVLCNALLVTEGYDCPEIDCVVMLRPTRSRAMYSQAVGRGTRIAPGKEDLLLLDFLWMTERHDLCRPASLLGKEQAVVDRLQERAEERGRAYDLMEEAERAETDVAAEREASLAKELDKMRRRKEKLVDPLQFATSIQDLDLMDYRPTFSWEREAPSERQRAFLDKHGIDSEAVESAGQASALIDAVVRRIDNHLATPKQVRCLERYGFQHVGRWSFDAANAMISRFAAAGWKPWKVGVDPATYDPREVA